MHKEALAKLEGRLETLGAVLEDERQDKGIAMGEVELEMKRQLTAATAQLEDIKKTDKAIISRVRLGQKEDLERARKMLSEERHVAQEALAELKRERLATEARAHTIDALRSELASSESQLECGKKQVQQLSMLLARSGKSSKAKSVFG